MRANSSDSQDTDTVTANQPVAATRLRWLELLSKYRQPIGMVVTLLLFGIALIACRHLLSELDLYALHDSILDVPKPALLGALAATVVGFVILLGYEWSASRYAGVNLPPRTLALGDSPPLPSATPSACRCSPAARCVTDSTPGMAWAPATSPI